MSTNRQRYLLFAIGVVAGLLALDRLVIGPYLDYRMELVTRRQDAKKELAKAEGVLRQEKEFRRTLVEMGDSLKADPSDVEGRVLHKLQGWKQQAGLSNASFQRIRSVEEKGFTRMSFSVSAAGNMGSLATLLYRVETAPMPLRVDDMEVTPRGKDGEELQLRLTVSTLCRMSPGAARGRALASARAVGGRS